MDQRILEKMIHHFSKQTGGWGTALRAKYDSDLFFRTSINIGIVSIGFVLVCLVVLALSLTVENVAWYIFVSILAVALSFMVLLARIMLRPIRDTLHYQKLFISNVAHELRTPLSTIKTSTEVALLDDKLSSSLRTTLADIISELDRASEIVNNLLSLNILSRPERIEFQNVDLGPLLDTVVERLSLLAYERNIQIVLKKDTYRTVWGNATALEQIMNNLIKNAISYTPKSAKGMIVASLYPDHQGSIIFSVEDNGIGISQKDLFHIFEPFYRADMSRVRNVRKIGSGIGLTIVNEIVRVHHGKINIQSTLHKGTTISVMLPAGLETGGATVNKGQQTGSEILLDFSKKS